MRDESLDEFESIFEQASVPVLQIDDVALERVSVVLTGQPLDDSVLRLGAYMRERFSSELRLHLAAGVSGSAVSAAGGNSVPERFASTAELVGQISIGRGQLVLLSDSDVKGALPFDLDDIVEGTLPPVMILRTPVTDPPQLFRRICHSLSGNFRQTQNFAYSFALAEDGGRLELLHVISDGEVEDVRDALLVSPGISASSREALLENLRHHGERYLKGVVAASRTRPFDVSYRLAVGDIVGEVCRTLERGEFGLLVLGAHHEGHSHIDADDYRLIYQVRDTAVLAL